MSSTLNFLALRSRIFLLSASLNPFLKISLLADQLSLTAVQHLRLVHFVIEFLLLLAVVVD